MTRYIKRINIKSMDGITIEYILKTDEDKLSDIIKEINTDSKYLYSIYYTDEENKLQYNF